ncbi:hypothetical protein BLJ79_12245 [Arthrobacter sp. UCD-GKA]|uniref:hypothetical protein n=1 Tax=Arthrobacter sp. UCD-GKA TaxID=1913576 RepID=UPI0008DC64F6|nr:hypothetical protein [Arthrobacter sp. UCD-GKA]OIH84231.1 hypothetical protein BLJ79_12245 [Arthrobacter sp. UCD-GKA]
MADKTPEAAKPKPKDDSAKAQDAVYKVAREKYNLGISTDGLPFAVPNNPRLPKVARPIASLSGELMLAMHRDAGVMVSRETITKTLDILDAEAKEHASTRLYLRTAPVGIALHIDLGDPHGRYVEVSPCGWTVCDPLEDREDDPAAMEATRPIFLRTAATAALPVPVTGGSRDALRKLMGLEADSNQWKLIWGWQVAAFFSGYPRPILWTLGPQGSGKSTIARMALCMVDPAEALGRAPGNSERDDFTSAAGRFVPSWDNIGSLSAKTSNWLCQLVTGISNDHRKLFTDAGLHIQTIRRSGVATSIVLPFGLGPDALERLVLVELERVDESRRKSESRLWSEFHDLQPMILGALLDDVAGVLANLTATRAEERPRPRMADYSDVLTALDTHLGNDAADGYAATYAASVHNVMADRAQDDPLTMGLLAIARAKGGTWRGPVEDLLKRLEPFRPDDFKAAWPTSPASLGGAMARGQETLRAAGLTVERKKVRGVRSIILRADPAVPEADGSGDPAPEPMPEPSTLRVSDTAAKLGEVLDPACT